MNTTPRVGFVVSVGDEFIGPRHLNYQKVAFAQAEIYKYKAAAKRKAHKYSGSKILQVTIRIDDES